MQTERERGRERERRMIPDRSKKTKQEKDGCGGEKGRLREKKGLTTTEVIQQAGMVQSCLEMDRTRKNRRRGERRRSRAHEAGRGEKEREKCQAKFGEGKRDKGYLEQ